MIKVIIVDDEQHCVDRLQMLLENYKSTIHIVALCSTITEAKKAIKTKRPNVVFLDVQLHDETGFDLLKSVADINFEVIFTTAYDNYAVDAFKFSALDYLLKPIGEKDLELSIQKIENTTSLKDIATKMDVLFHNFKKNNGVTSKKIAVPTIEGLTLILVSDIVRCQSDGNYTHLFLKDESKITASKTLRYFDKLLEVYNFFRTHQSYIINLDFVNKYIKGKGGYVLMMDGTSVEVAVRRKEELLNKLMGSS